MLVDSHCHLNYLIAQGIEIDDILSNAKANGIGCMQTISTNFTEFREILKIANLHKEIFCSVGLHPNNVNDSNTLNYKQIASLCKNQKTIGIGETGLDYYRDHDKELQKQSFIEHIKAAQETNIPLIVHTRDAEEDTLSILEDMMNQKPFKALIHCFTGTRDMAFRCIDIGLYLSISGIVTFNNALDLRETVKSIPLNRLMIETDSPYLAPQQYRGKTNEPGFVKYVAECISELKDVKYEEIANITTGNFFKVFAKAENFLNA